MKPEDFWYAIARSEDLATDKPLRRQLFGEWLVLFRGKDGKPVAMRDVCLHRCARLSAGRVIEGELQCGYHGWVYDGQGYVVQIPSEGPNFRKRPLRSKVFPSLETQDFVYVTLSELAPEQLPPPFAIPKYREPGWRGMRLINRFKNNVTNCAENFMDVPHTVFVHPRVFRVPERRPICATVSRKAGTVHVEYRGERANLGFFSWFLNAKQEEIYHTDTFTMPNVTCVEYGYPGGKRFFITSQSIPITREETLVYTDLTYDYGFWSFLAGPIVRNQAKVIIDQDIEILANQGETLEKYRQSFANSPADLIHTMIESVRGELEQGRDPRTLPELSQQIEFWI